MEMTDKDYSLFMQDNSEGDYGKEAILDYQLSWIMRVAASKEIQEKNNMLFERCKKVLLKLIGKSGCDNVEIVSVEVWKQWQRIDVTAHVVVKCNGKEEKHLVVIEDKAYTMIHGDQLNRYEETINETYDNDDWLKDFKKHFWVITFFEKEDAKYNILDADCKNTNWGLLSFYEVIDFDYTPTGSDLFDEFWVKDWN